MTDSGAAQRILTVFHEFPLFFTIRRNFCGERHEFVAYAALQLKFVRSPQKLRRMMKIGEIHDKTVEIRWVAPESVKNGEILVLNNPTSSKLVFYSIQVNIN